MIEVKYPLIEAISLEKLPDGMYSIIGEKEAINKLSKANVFVGGNNSGKSRFLRFLASQNTVQFMPTFDLTVVDQFIKKVTLKIQELSSKGSVKIRRASIIEVARITKVNGITDRKFAEVQRFIEEKKDVISDIADFFEFLYGNSRIPFTAGNYNYTSDEAKELFQNSLKDEKDFYDSLRAIYPKSGYSFEKLYIPILRGLRTFSDSDNMYLTRTVNDYFEEDSHPEIFTGLDLYGRVQNLLLGNLTERQSISHFQEFLSQAFFENKPVALIPRRDSDVLFVKIGNEEGFPVYQLGDGIQAVIIMTFPLFEKRDVPMLVFIEEPEMHLHPGLQRIFLNTVLKDFPLHQFFFTTHSNHFLDLTLEYSQISIYTFSKSLSTTDAGVEIPSFEIENVSNEDIRPLELLGVKNSSVFLSNCTIWVEGITDRKYIGHYLKLYMAHLEELYGEHVKAHPLTEKKAPAIFKEDLHYSFVEYSGGNITHFSFLDEEDGILVDRLCGKLFLITDKDGTKKNERHDVLRLNLEERYHCLESREIENVLSPAILKKVIEEYEGEPIEFKHLHRQYRDKYLGKFIEEQVLKNAKKRRGRYMEKSGTIAQKVDFCDRAILHMQNFSDLTEEAQGLAKKIYEFIKSNNSDSDLTITS